MLQIKEEIGLGNSASVGGGEEGISWACKRGAGWVEEWGYSGGSTMGGGSRQDAGSRGMTQSRENRQRGGLLKEGRTVLRELRISFGKAS